MVNTTLFVSAAISSAIHAAAILWTQPPLPYAIFLAAGCVTGLWNHGTTSDLAKWSDRTMMWTGLPLTFFIAPTPALQVLTLCIVPAYGTAKRFRCTAAHVAAHILITFIHLQILAFPR